MIHAAERRADAIVLHHSFQAYSRSYDSALCDMNRQFTARASSENTYVLHVPQDFNYS